MKIGEISQDGQGTRDAFHFACVSAKFVGGGVRLPGMDVKFVDDRCLEVVKCAEHERHGIIDPFVNAVDLQGNANFWVLLIPGATENLAHTFKVNLPGLPHFEVEEEEEEEDYDDYDDGCRGCN
jgi:hypothetical protein